MVKVDFLKIPILDLLQRLDLKINSIKIAVAYIKCSGVNLLLNLIPPKIEGKIITGLDFNITEPNALEALIDHGFEIRIFSRKNVEFHPKLYIFEADEKMIIIMGSSNLSKGGFQNNIEANIMITGKKNDSLIKDILSYFNTLWLDKNHCIPMTKDTIEYYKEIWRRHQSEAQKIRFKLKDSIFELFDKIKKLERIKLSEIILEFLRLKEGKAKLNEIYAYFEEEFLDKFPVSKKEWYKDITKWKEPRYKHHIRACLQHLKRKGLVTNPRRGLWVLEI
ncbi:MAG: phospholipase D-like domain-containing protein [archaeon GB-1867-035]|nr:phospholipase D-like domain-containing protein [Candidatus Culexmicrobium profundum]